MRKKEESKAPYHICRICSLSDLDFIQATGSPAEWIERDLCRGCQEHVQLIRLELARASTVAAFMALGS